MSDKRHFFFFMGLIQICFSWAQNSSNSNGAQIEGQMPSNNFEHVNIIGIYPNPATDHIIVEIKESQLHDTRFVLTSMIGNKIEITPEALGNDRFRLGLMDYPAGFYFLIIEDNPSKFKKAFRFLIR